MRAALIVTELALAVVLMVGAGLLVRTFWSLAKEYPGFNPSGVVTAGVVAPPSPQRPETRTCTPPRRSGTGSCARACGVFGALPGIEEAAITSALPATGQTFNVALAVENRPVESSAT